MSALAVSPAASCLAHLDAGLLDSIVDLCFAKLLDDYAVSRFFSGKAPAEQSKPLKTYLKAVAAGTKSDEQLTELLDEVFMAAFARTSSKRSHMGGDFDFLKEIAGGKEEDNFECLCDAHSHLLKLRPDDFQYNIFMGHLAETLQELQVNKTVQNEVLALAEHIRHGVLGK